MPTDPSTNPPTTHTRLTAAALSRPPERSPGRARGRGGDASLRRSAPRQQQRRRDARDAPRRRSPVRGVGGARGRERAGPTRSHPEPGRDPVQRRRVLWGRPHGRRGRRGRPRPPGDTHPRDQGQRERRTNQDGRARPPRGGAAAARWAHNPKVGGSNPPPATTSLQVRDASRTRSGWRLVIFPICYLSSLTQLR